MLGINIALFIICIVFSMCEAVLLQEKKRNEKNLSTITWLLFLISFIIGYYTINEISSRFSIDLDMNLLIVFSLFVYSIVFMLVAYKLPKRFANRYIEKVEPMMMPVIKFVSILFSWISWIFSFEIETKKETVSEEDIRELINTESEINVPQKEFIENVFELDDISVERICTHRSKVITLDLDESIEDWQKTIHDNRHTFYPVCGKDDDDIIGVLDTRDYFRIDGDLDQDTIINKAMDKPFFVSENTKADACFHEMKNQKTYFAIVLDEYGGMTGIITLHDIIETLLGEMNEVDDEIESEDIVQIDKNQWYINGLADLEEVQDTLNIELPIDEYDTFSGYVLSSLGKIPDDGTEFELDLKTMIINVKEVKNHRVGQTVVQIKEIKEPTENEES